MQNIKHSAAAIALALALTVPVAVPLTAQALTTGTLISYDTQMTQTFPLESGGAFLGTLRIAVNDDGIASGYYLPQDGSPELVSGGKTGDQMWLNLGDKWQVNATVSNGKIVGTARLRDETSLDRYHFEAALHSGT